MLRDGAPVGVILVARAEPGAFSDSQINLLKSFADQAVIAIENARLFETEQMRTNELQETLKYHCTKPLSRYAPCYTGRRQTASMLCPSGSSTKAP